MGIEGRCPTPGPPPQPGTHAVQHTPEAATEGTGVFRGPGRRGPPSGWFPVRDVRLSPVRRIGLRVIRRGARSTLQHLAVAEGLYQCNGLGRRIEPIDRLQSPGKSLEGLKRCPSIPEPIQHGHQASKAQFVRRRSFHRPLRPVHGLGQAALFLGGGRHVPGRLRCSTAQPKPSCEALTWGHRR